MSEFDSRSERLIGTLLPDVQPWAREFLRRARATGVDARIISGTRSYAEQNALYAKGRTAAGPVVTNARGGFSNHNFGIAWDVGVFQGGNYLGSSPLYAQLGKLGREMGLEWGGDWKSFPDRPHFQVKTGLSLKQLRSLVTRGAPLPVPSMVGSPARSGLEVTLDGEDLAVAACLLDGRVCLAARECCEALGGTLLSAGGSPFRVRVALNGEELEAPGEIIDGKGFVRFIDLNELLGYEFSYSGGRLHLRSSDV